MTTPATTAATATFTPGADAGRFVWHDLMSTDPERSLAFYQALFGWTTQTQDMGAMGTYTMLLADGQGIGGVVPLDPSHGVPAHWIGYTAVADVDAACARVEALGGKTCVPPTDIPGVGRFAVAEDPTGAVFSPFAPAPMRGDAPPEPMMAPVGAMAWHELTTTDPAACVPFYRQLFGWGHDTMDMGPMGTYHLFKRGERFAGGMMQMPAGAPMRPHWLCYVAVASADAAAARIAELGGTVLVAPRDINDWGRFAVALDPTGAGFAVLEDKTRA